MTTSPQPAPARNNPLHMALVQMIMSICLYALLIILLDKSGVLNNVASATGESWMVGIVCAGGPAFMLSWTLVASMRTEVAHGMFLLGASIFAVFSLWSAAGL